MNKFKLTNKYRPNVVHNIVAYMAIRKLFKQCKPAPLTKVAMAAVVPKDHPHGGGMQFVEYLIGLKALRKVA